MLKYPSSKPNKSNKCLKVQKWSKTTQRHTTNTTPTTIPKRYNSNNTNIQTTIVINRRMYKKPQLGQTYVGMSLEGTSSEYLHAAMSVGKMPNLKKLTSPAEFSTLFQMMKSKQIDQNNDQNNTDNQNKRSFFEAEGVIGVAAACFPTYSTPNNASILTGVSPLHHGISSNYYQDDNGDEIFMARPEFFRSDSILAKIYQNDPNNTKITIITAKKMVKKLSLHQLPPNYIGSEFDNTPTDPSGPLNPNIRAFCLETLQTNPARSQPYLDLLSLTSSQHIELSQTHHLNSVYTLRLAKALHSKDKQDGFDGSNLFYISTNDYVQHRHAPGSSEANELMYELDKIIGEFHQDGAVIGVTAAHGMNEKTHFNGSPDITYISQELELIGVHGKVIVPNREDNSHHEQIGGFISVYLDREKYQTKNELDNALTKSYSHLRSLKGCYSVIGRDDAKRGLDLPEDRTGDFIVIGHRNSVFGTRPEEHRLGLNGGMNLRGHGSLEESLVPLVYNRPLGGEFQKRFSQGKIRNFDLFYGLFSSVQL
jgi:phosphonoacetate hydrolase